VLLYASERIVRLFRSHDAVRIQKVPTINKDIFVCHFELPFDENSQVPTSTKIYISKVLFSSIKDSTLYLLNRLQCIRGMFWLYICQSPLVSDIVVDSISS
jgi:hypothetical protein